MTDQEKIYEYVKRWKCFYGNIPYSTGHFWRVLRGNGVLPAFYSEGQVKTVLEKLCQESRLIRIGKEYMLYPSNATIQVKVNAFMKGADKITEDMP